MRTREFKVLIILGAIPTLFFYVFSFYHGNAPFLTPDSPSYMYFGEDRPAGYPLFLALIQWISGSFFPARYIQLALLCLSLGLLAFIVYWQDKSLKLSLALEVLLFANPGLLMLSESLMSDCLSATCIALFCATVIHMQKSKTPWPALALCAITGLSLTLRLVNITLLPAAMLAMMLHGTRKGLSLLVLMACVVLAYDITPVVHLLRGEGNIQPHQLARELFQKTLFRQWPENAETRECEGELIASDTRDADAYLAAMPNNLRPMLYHPFSSYLRFMVILPELAAKHHTIHYADIDPVLMCYTLARMRSEPLYFAQDAVQQFWDLLTYSTFISASKHNALANYLAAHPPVLPEPVVRHDADYQLRAQALADTGQSNSVFSNADGAIRPPKSRPQIAVLSLRLFQLFAALSMITGILVWLRQDRVFSHEKNLQSLAIIGIAFYLQMGAIAITEIALPRYIFPLWPMMCAAIILAFRIATAYSREATRTAL